jgi:hypothetical protein
MLFNNMTNVIKNLEQSKSVCDIIDDLNELMLTLRGRNHDEPEQVKTETKPEQLKHVPEPVKAVTMTPEQVKTVTKKAATRPAAGSPRPAAAGPPSESDPVQKQTKAKAAMKAPGRGKVECQCGLMICGSAMSRHEKGTKHKEAMTKKEKTELKQAEGQTLGVNDMDLVDIETYMKVMLPHLYKKVRGLGGKSNDDEKFGFMKIEGDRDKIIDTMYNIIMPDVNRKLCNTLPRKFDELMNSTKKYNRYESIFNKSFEAYKTKNRYVYFIIISKNNEVYLTTYERLHTSEQKQIEENYEVYDDKTIIDLYEKEKDIFDEEIERINKSIFG